MGEQEAAKPEAAERGEECCCPVCGGMHHMPWGPMKMKHMMREGGMGPWGMGPWGMRMAPWGGMGPCGRAMMCVGPALLAFGIGMMLGRKQHHWRWM